VDGSCSPEEPIIARAEIISSSFNGASEVKGVERLETRLMEAVRPHFDLG
jgi:hypothetical protein